MREKQTVVVRSSEGGPTLLSGSELRLVLGVGLLGEGIPVKELLLVLESLEEERLLSAAPATL